MQDWWERCRHRGDYSRKRCQRWKKIGKFKQVLKNMGVIFKNIGTATGQVLKNMEIAEKKMQENMGKNKIWFLVTFK